MTPADRELLRLLAADPTVRGLAARVLLACAVVIGGVGLYVATTGGTC